MKKIMMVLLAFTLMLAGCGAKDIAVSSSAVPDMQSSKAQSGAQYKKISAEEAKDMSMDGAIFVDVRTKEEYDSGHITGALLLPSTDIKQNAETALPDMAQAIIVYCRSGNRSAAAAKELIELGYQNVYDMGGISDWTGEIVTGAEEDVSTKQKAPENPAPNFSFTDFDGNTVTLADFSGKPLYVKFWASWCPVCLSTFGETDTLAAEDKDFEVITVVAPDVSGEKSADSFKEWYNGLGYKNTTVLFDEGGTYMQELGVRAFPSSAYIDANGSLIDFKVGHLPNDAVKQVFDEYQGGM